MADVPRRLIGPTVLANAAATLYTVPTGSTVIVRHIRVANTTGGAVTATLSIGADAAGTRLLPALSVAANSVYDWTGFLVVNSAEIIQGFAGAATSLTITISGVEVTP